MKKRVEKLRGFMDLHGLQGMIITKPENRRYFSGFSGSAGMLVISETTSNLLTDFRYIEQATAQAEQYEVLRYQVSANEIVAELTKKLGITKIGFESDFVIN